VQRVAIEDVQASIRHLDGGLIVFEICAVAYRLL
jgi:hypothetical protein